MPFPVSSQPKNTSYGPRIILDRPILAQQIAVVCNSWSFIEAELPFILATMLGPNAKLGVAMFMAVISGPARSQVVRAVANEVLSPARQSELETLIKDLSGRQSERNRIAHAMWASSGDYPDDILMIDTEKRLITESLFAQNRAALLWNNPVHPSSSPRLEFTRYTLNCFKDAIARIIALHTDLRKYREAIETDRHIALSEEYLVSVVRGARFQQET